MRSVLRTQDRLVLRKKAEKRLPEQRGLLYDADKKLTLTHKKDLRVILEDFQLVLNDGDKAVIIGEEGTENRRC